MAGKKTGQRQPTQRVPVKGNAQNVVANAKNKRKAKAATPGEAIRQAEQRNEVPVSQRVPHQRREIGNTGVIRKQSR